MNAVLDASAVLALLNKEPGAEKVFQILMAGAAICTANLAEIATCLARSGAPDASIRALPGRLPVDFVDVDEDLALRAALMVNATRPFGLSLADRLCLALAARLSVPAVTADRAWAQAAPALGPTLGIKIELIR